MLNHDNLSMVDWIDKKFDKAPNSLHPLFSTRRGVGGERLVYEKGGDSRLLAWEKRLYI